MRKVARSGLGAQPGTGGTDSTGQIGPATIRPPIPESGARAPAGLTLSRTNPRSKHALRRIAQRNQCEDGGGAVASQTRRQKPPGSSERTVGYPARSRLPIGRCGLLTHIAIAGQANSTSTRPLRTPIRAHELPSPHDRLGRVARACRVERPRLLSPGATARATPWCHGREPVPSSVTGRSRGHRPRGDDRNRTGVDDFAGRPNGLRCP
jgi:hypothetical protein